MASPSASWSYQASPNYYEVKVVNRVHRVFSFSLEVKPLCHVLVLARQVLQPAPLYLAVFHKLVGIFIYRWLFGSSSWSQSIQINLGRRQLLGGRRLGFGSSNLVMVCKPTLCQPPKESTAIGRKVMASALHLALYLRSFSLWAWLWLTSPIAPFIRESLVCVCLFVFIPQHGWPLSHHS